MNDIYIEHIIKQKMTAIKMLGYIGLYVLAFVISILVFGLALTSPLIMTFALPLAVGSFIGAWWLSCYLSIEYEYIFTNGELDVDRIVARRKRKRFLTIDVQKFDVMEKAQGHTFEKYEKDPYIKVKFDASRSKDDPDRYYAVFNNKQGVRMMLIFSPSRKILDEIKRFNPRNVVVDND